jgi:hypothetical protein
MYLRFLISRDSSRVQRRRNLFALLRSGEILIGAAMAPLVDRSRGQWPMAGGAMVGRRFHADESGRRVFEFDTACPRKRTVALG